MSTLMDEETKRWTAKRKTALVLEIIQGKTRVLEASRTHDLPPSEIEGWVEDGRKGMGDALKANPAERARTVRAPVEGTPGGLRRSNAGSWPAPAPSRASKFAPCELLVVGSPSAYRQSYRNW